MKAHKVDVFAILTYIAGLGGLTGAITVPENNHTLKTSLSILGAASFMAGLAVRTFYNQTASTPTGQASSEQPVVAPVNRV